MMCAGLPPGAVPVHLTEEEQAAIGRLEGLGFDRNRCIEAFLLCGARRDPGSQLPVRQRHGGAVNVQTSSYLQGRQGSQEHITAAPKGWRFKETTFRACCKEARERCHQIRTLSG